MVRTGRCVLLVNVILASLVGVCYAGETESGTGSDALSSSSTSPSDPSKAIVLISATGPTQGARLGLGSVVGDGSLVVTPYHIVFEASDIGRHTLPLFPLVISPYLGEVCYGRILAADRESDLAVLQVPWSGHPGFQLLEDKNTYHLDNVVIYSPTIERSEAGSTDINLVQVRTERLAVKSVTCCRGVPTAIRLAGFGCLTHGWSGAPMLTEPANLFAACFTTIERNAPRTDLSLMPERSLSPRWQDSAFGPASAWVRQVVAGTGEAERLLARGTRRSRPADANKAVGYVLRALGLSGSSSIDPQERAKALDEFLLLRPASTCAMTLKAVHLAASGKSADAEELFRQALCQNPSNLPACVKLGESLAAQRREDEALELYERARHLEPQNSYISVAIAGIFSLHKPEDVALEKINALSAEFPDNRYLLAARATVYSRGKKHNEMLATVKEVVRLMPEDGIYRRILADQLKQLGRLDEAEVQLRDIITLRPADPEARLKLARFLAECRPEARDKAVEMAKQAMALASQQGSDTTAIQNLLDELEGR